MALETPTFTELERLGVSSDIRDRAFAASALRFLLRSEDAGRTSALYERIRGTASDHHAELRQRIREGSLDKRAFLTELHEAPFEIRDHLVEEILDIAYPPLEEIGRSREAFDYLPSGLSEILFALEHACLGPESTFVDLGSGLGKVVLLVALLSGARAIGVELDPRLASHARSAARSMNLGNARFIEGDIREIALPPADAYYMYIPLLRSADVAARLEEFARRRKIVLLSQALDTERLPWLRSANAGSYWLEMYEGGSAARTTHQY